ncbi:MAG: hypothetical protein FJW32_07840 [Acidobacteria bacterium]|nr:hypothetical protein [Acidobacteriota bacterium]
MRRLALLLASLLPLAAQADPAAAGPLTVATQDYKIAAVPMPTVAYPIDIWGQVWYPEDLAKGPYPFVFLLHGNHGICRAPGSMVDLGTTSFPPNCPPGQVQTPNHAGYDYLARRLASHGYIVASMNANAINVRANGNPERGQVVVEHLRYWQAWNSPAGGEPFGTMFSGKVDLQNIGLMGHSRGGEGVRAALEFNRQAGRPFGIKGIIEIGPVDFGRTTSPTLVTTGNPVYDAADTAWSVILPSCDADVSDNQGMRAFDRAFQITETAGPTPKSQLYILGANHNFYNSEWTPEDPGFSCIDFPIITDRPQQEAIGTVYVNGFMRTYLGGEKFQYLFHGDSDQPTSIRTPVAHSYAETPARNLLIDNFQGAFSPMNTLLGGPNATGNIAAVRCIDTGCRNPPPAAWRHDPGQAAVRLDWPDGGTGTPYYAIHVGPDGGGPRDVSAYALFSFRVAAAFDPKNPVIESQNFSLRMVDATGAVSKLIPVTNYKAIPYPTGYGFRRSVLRTVRIPLADFAGVDFKQLTRVDLIFDKQPQGALFLADVLFAPARP